MCGVCKSDHPSCHAPCAAMATNFSAPPSHLVPACCTLALVCCQHRAHASNRSVMTAPPVASSTAAASAAHAAPSDLAAEQYVIRNFSREQDSEEADACAVTLGQAMGGSDTTSLFCTNPELSYPRWHAVGHNYQLSKKHISMLYSLRPSGNMAGSALPAPPPAVAYAYWYPEDEEQGESKPEGMIDMAQHREALSFDVLQDLLAFLDQGKKDFHEERGPFFYIAFLSTSPDSQGQGLGSRLMAHLLARADAAGKWTYLEATNDDNARLYERHGFKRLGSDKLWTLDALPGRKARIIRMGRPPKSAVQQQ